MFLVDVGNNLNDYKKLINMYKKFRPVIKSRHPSHSKLRSRNGRLLSLLPFKSVIRFGSSKELDDTIINGGSRIISTRIF